MSTARTAAEKQLTLETGEHAPPSSKRSAAGGKRPPLIRCQCGRLHRSWNPRKVCAACIRESRSGKHAEVAARVLELDRRRLNPTPAEREQDRAVRTAIHERWLAKQSLDHPWRVAGPGGEA